MAGHRRNSLRLHGYDYASAGAYFITVCTSDRLPLFGTIKDGHVILSRCGHSLSGIWRRVVTQVHGAELDEFIVMPDHFHAIVWLNSGHAVGAADYPPFADQPKDLSALMRHFKGAVTTAINATRNTPGRPVWQRGYYDRIIRDERELDMGRRYVRFNAEKCLMTGEISVSR